MSKFEDFINNFSVAAKEFAEEIGEAWGELKEDLHDIVAVKYLRPGGIAFCKADGQKHYGILTGTQIISLNGDGEPEYSDLEEFLSKHGSGRIRVAGKNRIAVGSHEVDFAARMEVGDGQYPSDEAFVLHCLGESGTGHVDEAIEHVFGDFDWMDYDLPTPDADDENDAEAQG